MLISSMAKSFVPNYDLNDDPEIKLAMIQSFANNPRRKHYNVAEDLTYIFKKCGLTSEERLIVLEKIFSCPKFDSDVFRPIYKLLSQEEMDFVLDVIYNKAPKPYNHFWHWCLISRSKISITLSQKEFIKGKIENLLSSGQPFNMNYDYLTMMMNLGIFDVPNTLYKASLWTY